MKRPGGHRTSRPGGRSARVVSTVLRATLKVLGRSGYARFRIDEVATAAGVNKTTIYRRWPTRADLVLDALGTTSIEPVVENTGDVVNDLTATLLHASSLWRTRVGRGIARVLIAERGDPEVDRIVAGLRTRHRAPAYATLRRARTQGHLPAAADLDLMLDLLFGAMYTRLRESAAPLDPKWIKAAVRLVVAGAVNPAGAKAAWGSGSG